MAFRSMNILNVDEYGATRVYQYGIDRVYDEFQVVLEIHNKRMNMLYDTLVGARTSEKRHRFGAAGASLKMVRVGRETGRAHAQSTTFKPYDVGVPIDKYELSQAWTKRYAQRETVERMNAQLTAALTADKKLLQWKIGTALFGNANYDFFDEEGDGQTYPVKRLLNADSLPIPVGPHGDVFDETTHSHYMVIASVSAATMKTVSTNLAEHSESGEQILEVAYEDVALYRAITGFIPAEDGRIIQSLNSDRIALSLNRNNIRDRFIGYIPDGPAVWVKPYIPAGYGFTYLDGGDLGSPLVEVYDDIDGQGLIVAEPERINSKQEARSVARIGGFGCLERRNGVVFWIDAEVDPYEVPAIYAIGGQP